jgi:hypothetical protein
MIVKDTIPECEVTFAPGAGPDIRNYRVNCDKIASVLPEFQPQWDARRGAQELYDSYHKHGLELNDFEGPRYKRIAHIKQLLTEGALNNELRWIEEPAGQNA